MEAAQKPKIFYGYIIVVACFFIMMVYWGMTYSYGIFFDSLIKEFGWDRALTSGAYSIMGLLFGLTSIPTAKLCYKFGPRIVIGSCGVFMGIGYILMSQIHYSWQLYLFYDVFISVGMGSYISLLPLVIRWFTKRRALMTGALSSGMGLGSVIFPPIVHQLISVYQWRATYIILGVVVIVVTLIASQFLKWDPRNSGLRPYGETESENRSFKLTGIAANQAVRTREFWLVCLLYFTYLFCQTSILVHIFLHATDLKVPAASAVGIVSVYGIFQIIGMNVLGHTADKTSNKKAMLIACILMTISFIWLIFVARNIPTFYIFAAIMGFAAGSMQIIFSPMLAEIFGLKSHGIILGYVSFVACWGAASGAFVAGYIYDVNHSYTLAFIIGTILAAGSVLTTLYIRPLAGKIFKDSQPS